ncbi:MAG: hypothetical protein QW244_00190 [Candidatus Pacearchaeota archaeon]
MTDLHEVYETVMDEIENLLKEVKNGHIEKIRMFYQKNKSALNIDSVCKIIDDVFSKKYKEEVIKIVKSTLQDLIKQDYKI